MGYAVSPVDEYWQYRPWVESQQPQRAPRPARKRRSQQKKSVSVVKAVMHGGTLILGVLFTLQLVVSAGQLINQWVLLEQKVPEAHRLHAKALTNKQQLQQSLARLGQASGLEKMAREQLDYSAPGETLVRLY